jgi:tetratricopeptide (TPR) repeat protein
MRHGNARFARIVLGCALAAGWFASAGFADEQEYRGPEYYQSRGKTEDFIPEAKRYFDAHADYEIAPSVAFDLYMAAVLRGDTPLAEWAMARLVFDYPESLSTRFLLTTIPQPANYGKFLAGRFNGPENVPGSRFLRKFAGAVDLGVHRFGPQFISEDDLLICCAFAARDLGLLRLAALCDQNSRNADGDVPQIVQALLSDQPAPAERLVRLQQFADRPVVRTCQRQMLAALSPEARESTPVRRVVAENLLRDQQFAEALPLADRLAAESGDPQARFWKGWCLASVGRHQESVAALEALLQEHPESEWRRPAEKLLQSATHSDEILDAHATALHRAILKLKSEAPESMELRARYLPERGAPVEICIWQDTLRQEMEVMCRKASRPLFAYLSGPGSTRVFLAGESRIHHYEQPGMMLATRCSIDAAATGGYQCNFHWQLVGRGGDAAGLYRWFESPALSSEAGVRDMLTWTRSRGTVFEEISSERETRELRWHDPAPDRPEMKSFSLTIGSDDRLVAARFDRLIVDVFRHGPAGKLQRMPSDWPQHEIERHASVDGPVMMRLMTAVMSLFTDQNEPQQLAVPPSDSTIRR